MCRPGERVVRWIWLLAGIAAAGSFLSGIRDGHTQQLVAQGAGEMKACRQLVSQGDSNVIALGGQLEQAGAQIRELNEQLQRVPRPIDWHTLPHDDPDPVKP